MMSTQSFAENLAACLAVFLSVYLCIRKQSLFTSLANLAQQYFFILALNSLEKTFKKITFVAVVSSLDFIY